MDPTQRHWAFRWQRMDFANVKNNDQRLTERAGPDVSHL